ncbi:MAG: adenylate/guanylate cyclase domain-containing protein, partial [Chloroflexota bacterium]|nr:adenylate/guanylate cyclase domain-containing protein [Chloroflexota bacterium]
MKCPHCEFDSPPQMLYCGMCGTQLARRCPECGFVNPAAYNFCGMCGAPLALAADAITPPVALPEPLELPVASQPQDIPLDLHAMDEAESALGVSQLAGERRLATVILADVCSSTRILEQVGTEAWVRLMNNLFQVLEAEIYRFEGTVDQFRGDGLVAFFGARGAHEDDPERGVLAALAMQRAVARYARQLTPPVEIGLRIRIGVNTGKVIVTRIGDRRQYSEETAMGEAVTLAARLETAAEPGTVLVSENTYQLLENQFEWLKLDPVALKGLREPVPVYRPVAPLWQAESLPAQENLHGYLPSLIGHKEEFAALKRAVEELYDARGGIVTVTGAKGMGKTFLVEKTRQFLERQGMLLAEARRRDLLAAGEHLENRPSDSVPAVTWLSGRCRSYDQSWPYSVWVDLLLDWLAVQPEEPPPQILERLRDQSQHLWGERCAEYYPYLATLLRLPVEPEFAASIERLGAEVRRRQIFLAVRNWVMALAKEGSLVISFADMHWVDTTSLDLLRYSLPLCDTEALLWVLVFRPDRHSPVWDFFHYVETEYPHRWTDIPIPPLTTTQSAEFINHLIGEAALPTGVSELVVRQAEGNPYYIKELLSALVTQGILVQDVDGQWQTSRPVISLDVPDSLQTLLLARIDRLAAAERHLLQVASVIGTIFWEKVLRDLLEEQVIFRVSLTNLQRAQFIEERRRVPDLGMEYGFTSSLMREVVYDSLLNDQRETYHLQAAEYLASFLDSEAECPHRYGMIAYHYRQAGLLAKALNYALKAAQRAVAFYANTEARYHYTCALELLAELLAGELPAEERHARLRQRFEVLDARREAHYLLGDLESGRADALAMLELARQELSNDRDLLIDALLEQPGVGSVQGREERAAGVPLAQEALWLAQELGDQQRELRVWLALTNLYNLGSDPAWRQSGQRALELARQLSDQHAEVDALLLLAGGYGLDNLEQARGYYERALQIAQQWEDKAAELTVLAIARTPLIWEGDYY